MLGSSRMRRPSSGIRAACCPPRAMARVAVAPSSSSATSGARPTPRSAAARSMSTAAQPTAARSGPGGARSGGAEPVPRVARLGGASPRQSLRSSDSSSCRPALPPSGERSHQQAARGEVKRPTGFVRLATGGRFRMQTQPSRQARDEAFRLLSPPADREGHPSRRSAARPPTVSNPRRRYIACARSLLHSTAR